MKRLALLLPLLALTACGGATAPKIVQPHLPRALASDWRAQVVSVAEALDAGDGCEAQKRAVALQAAVITAVNAHRVPPRFQETLVSSVNELASRIGCTPPAAAPAPTPSTSEGGGGKGHAKGPKKHGHGKHEKDDD